MKKIISILAVLLLFSACTGKMIDVKSPCVSTEDGPCGQKKSINNWWLKNSQNSHKENS